jgi:hypothetical protein
MESFKQFRDLKKGEQIYIFGDTSFGCGDESTCAFFSSKRFDYPMVWGDSVIATEMTDEVYPIFNWISDETGVMPLVAYERNNGGAFEMERLAKLNKLGKYDIFRMPVTDTETGEIEKSDKIGYDTNTATRPQMLSHFKEVVDSKLIRIYDKKTVEQMFSFIRVQHSNAIKAEAEKNAHDDRVMAHAGAYEMYVLYPDLGAEMGALARAQQRYSQGIGGEGRGAGGY